MQVGAFCHLVLTTLVRTWDSVVVVPAQCRAARQPGPSDERSLTNIPHCS